MRPDMGQEDQVHVPAIVMTPLSYYLTIDSLSFIE